MGSRWPPGQDPKDCGSLPLCSIYCPEWCGLVWPPPSSPFRQPPPPRFPHNDENHSRHGISPLGITLAALTAATFILIAYHIFHKHCLREHRQGRGPLTREQEINIATAAVAAPQPSSPTSTGLEESLISRITVHKYHSGDDVVREINCSVCLSEFQEEETLRLLPKCSHAFHVQCIDIWLRSHASCPLCRVCILSPLPLSSQESELNQTRIVESPVVVQAQDSQIGLVGTDNDEEEKNHSLKEIQEMSRSFSMDHMCRWRDSIEMEGRGEGSSSKVSRSTSMNHG